MPYVFHFVNNYGVLLYNFVLVLHLLFVSELHTYHYSMSSLFPAIKHLERTFQATFIIDDSKNVSAQFSGHLFIFSIDRVPSILDKIPNKVILGQSQRSITTMYMINSFKGGPWKQHSHCNSFSEDPTMMNALSCFSSRFMVWHNYLWRKNISLEGWMVTTHCVLLLFELKANIRQCKFRVMCLQIVQFWADGSTERVWCLQLSNCV